jgi:uncharacterized membrane protein
MRKLFKFLHTMAAIGFLGAILAFVVIHTQLPEASGLAASPTELASYASLRTVQGAVARWVLLPSMGLVLISGLLSMAVVPAYQNQGWVWAKLLSGAIVFEGTLVYVQGPMERAARRARAALAGDVPVAELGTTLGAEWGSFWVIGAVAVANVVLGVWRPRFSSRTSRARRAEQKRPDGGAAEPVTPGGAPERSAPPAEARG